MFHAKGDIVKGTSLSLC